jgi:hypothetical protein
MVKPGCEGCAVATPRRRRGRSHSFSTWSVGRTQPESARIRDERVCQVLPSPRSRLSRPLSDWRISRLMCGLSTPLSSCRRISARTSAFVCASRRSWPIAPMVTSYDPQSEQSSCTAAVTDRKGAVRPQKRHEAVLIELILSRTAASWSGSSGMPVVRDGTCRRPRHEGGHSGATAQTRSRHTSGSCLAAYRPLRWKNRLRHSPHSSHVHSLADWRSIPRACSCARSTLTRALRLPPHARSQHPRRLRNA